GLAACLLTLSSCGQSPQARSSTGSPGTSSSTRITPSASVSPTAAGLPPASSARATAVTSIGGLNCTLPVALNEDGWDDHYITGTPHGGFVSFPSARLNDDPASRVRFADSGSLVTSVAKPVLDGRWPGPVFDWQLKRWVPAMNPAVVSPDGSAYVYA